MSEIRWSVKLDSENPSHTRLTLFEDGGNAGRLCLTANAYPHFVDALANHASRIRRIKELKAALATAKREALEECAQLAEAYCINDYPGGVDTRVIHTNAMALNAVVGTASEIAQAIRTKLKELDGG